MIWVRLGFYVSYSAPEHRRPALPSLSNVGFCLLTKLYYSVSLLIIRILNPYARNMSSILTTASIDMGYKTNSAVLGFLFLAAFLFQRHLQRKSLARSHRCGQAVSYQPKEPFTGFDFQMRMYNDIPFLYNLHQRYGTTYQVGTWVSLPTVCTIAPENLRAINTSKDFGVGPMRLAGMEYFCGRGFITTDGDTWKQSRNLLKPSFDLSNISDLSVLRKEVDMLLDQLPKDGTTVDLQPLLYVMVRPSTCINCFES